MPPLKRLVLRLPSLLLSATVAFGGVVINEVMYHPPDDRDDLQFIELHNPDATAVALKDWSFTKGVQFTFPAVTLPPGGYAVICRDAAAFGRHYPGVPVASAFTGRLKHGGERLELSDAAGRVVDTVKFSDRAPWPHGPDGYGASLERMTATAPGDDPFSWAGSELPAQKVAGGTPGKLNSAHAKNLPPAIGAVEFSPPQPGQPVTVAAQVTDTDGVKTVELRYRALEMNAGIPEQTVAMRRVSGDEKSGRYEGVIPAQPANRLLRFRVQAADVTGAERFLPAPQEPRPTFSAYLLVNTNDAAIPQAHLLSLGGRERPGSSRQMGRFASQTEPARGVSAFIYLPTNGGPVQTFDHIRLTPRNGGIKVRLHKDAPLGELTTLNLLYEGKPRWLLSEPLGYEVFRRLGVPAPLTDHVRVWSDGRPLGHHLLVEQPNSSFLRRNGRDDEGNAYKLLWYGQGLVGQHEKKNNPEAGHGDLLKMVDALNRTRGNAQWELIQRHFNVDGMIGYFAASMCILNWDGFFNNYYAYRAPGTDGKWEMFPWDLDKTWGDFDGASPEYDWHTMPLTYGMNGDRDQGGGLFRPRTSPWGSTSWWRPGGYFSGPLLANPQFRERFLKRLREVCETEFTEAKLLPVINDLERRLAPEVRFRAQVSGQDETQELARFERHIESFRRQVKLRREFLLGELR